MLACRHAQCERLREGRGRAHTYAKQYGVIAVVMARSSQVSSGYYEVVSDGQADVCRVMLEVSRRFRVIEYVLKTEYQGRGTLHWHVCGWVGR